MQYEKKKLTRIIATDCGSTTTKAILIEFVDGEYRQTVRGEAPTTVEAPLNDVTRGVLNAVQELEELARLKYNNPNITLIQDANLLFHEMAISDLMLMFQHPLPVVDYR